MSSGLLQFSAVALLIVLWLALIIGVLVGGAWLLVKFLDKWGKR